MSTETIETGWRPIESAPELDKVLVAYRNPLGNWRVVCARLVGKHQIEADPDDDRDDFHDFDADTETYYWPPGWYEVNVEQGEEWAMECAPSHWQPLPAPPAAQRQEQEGGSHVG